jgi:hypothetical protein
MQWCDHCSPSVAGLVVSCGWGLLGQSSQIFVLLLTVSCGPAVSGVAGPLILLAWRVMVLF